ncbi:MAG: aminopeptidase, partial [Gemmatimonadota bacterium]
MADRLPVARRALRLAVRVAGYGLATLIAVLAVAAVATPMGRYVARAAWEEGKILARRRVIAEVLAEARAAEARAAEARLPEVQGGDDGDGGAVESAAVSPEERRRLQLVVDARTFAAEAIGLDAGKSFTTYSALERDTLVLVLSAARRDTLAPYTWWFPVVGRFPYKGFFDFAEAQQTAADMRRRGLDTYLRPASAFSTLG